MSPVTQGHFGGFATVAKAGTGGVITAGTAVTAALQDGVITGGEWVGIVAALIVGVVGVWAVPNKDPKGKVQDESVQPPKRPTRRRRTPKV